MKMAMDLDDNLSHVRGKNAQRDCQLDQSEIYHLSLLNTRFTTTTMTMDWMLMKHPE